MARRPAAMEVRVILAASYAASAALAGMAVLFLARRMAGEFQQPVGGWAFLVTGLGAGGIAGLVRFALWRWTSLGNPLHAIRDGLQRIRHRRAAPCPSSVAPPAGSFLHDGWPAILTFSVAGPAAMALMAAITLPGTAAWAIFIAWFGLVAAEAATWMCAGWRTSLGRMSRVLSRHWMDRERHAYAGFEAGDRPAQLFDSELPAGLVQQLTRIREDETESLHVVLRIEVPVGERVAIAHVAFCPPLDAPPEIEVHAIGVDDAEVRVAVAEAFGARFEVRLPHAGTMPRQVLLEVLGAAAATAQPAIERRTGSG